ncbi:ribosomal protein L2 family [Actinidia rufa]|uniref:Ribosomal protein L2 family n=1 Tax=Actinidia rufa TaxID=165716 RepID=A0A7J0GNU9_9ERIC|nr:ribosomal protein L2 family [Actinidia rufa]
MHSGQFIFCGKKPISWSARSSLSDPSSRVPSFVTLNTMSAITGSALGLPVIYAIVISHNPDNGTSRIKLPSGAKKVVSSRCRAMIDQVAGGRTEKPVVKAGNAYHKYRVKRNCWPKVRGVAMNPVEHPHGPPTYWSCQHCPP